MSSKKYELRPYQSDCKNAIEQAGDGRHLVVLATGLGKTVVFTHLEGMGRTLILSHRDELVRQPEKYYEGRCSFGVEKAAEHAGDEEIVSASVQSLQQDNRLNTFSKDAFDTIIIDEAHHAAAKSYKKILDYFSGAKRRIGFTATPKRGDSVGLDSVFDDIVFIRDLRWGIENKYLSNIRCERVYSSYSLSGVQKQNGDYSASQLTEILSAKNVDAIPIAAKAYVEKCHNTGRHTLVYCVTKRICSLLLDTIQKMLPEEEKDTIRILTGDTPDDERKAILSGFQNGDIRAIINCMVLTEGTDLPICDAVLNLRPTCNDSLYQQMIGRGTRLYEGKEYCLIIDIVPQDESINHSICTAPTMFGIHPEALDKRIKKQLNESVDLLSFCNNLSEEFASAAAKLDLESSKFDLFISEVEDLIKENAETGIEGFSKAYAKLLESKRESDTDYDFGNLDVQIQADEARYYRINPSWGEAIYLSKPDAIGMTNVLFCVDYFSNVSHFHGRMKMQDAIDLIKKYCKTRPPYTGYSWNREMQESWTTVEATGTQIGKIQREYNKLGLSVPDDAHLNKMEASRIIDLSERLKDAKKKSKMFALAKSNKKTKSALKVKDEVEAYMKERDSKEDNSDTVRLFRERINQTISLQKKAEEYRRRQQEEFLKKERNVKISAQMLPQAGKPASESQMSYARSLYEQVRRKGCTFHGDLPNNMTMRQASVCISFLKTVAYDENYQNLEFVNPWNICFLAESQPQSVYLFEFEPKSK